MQRERYAKGTGVHTPFLTRLYRMADEAIASRVALAPLVSS